MHYAGFLRGSIDVIFRFSVLPSTMQLMLISQSTSGPLYPLLVVVLVFNVSLSRGSIQPETVEWMDEYCLSLLMVIVVFSDVSSKVMKNGSVASPSKNIEGILMVYVVSSHVVWHISPTRGNQFIFFLKVI